MRSPRARASAARRSVCASAARRSCADAVEESCGVVRAHAAEAREDVVDLARVGARVEQRPRVAAARVVAHDDGEAVQPLGARGRRDAEERRERAGDGEAGPLHDGVRRRSTAQIIDGNVTA